MEQSQPKYHTKHELFSDEEEEDSDEEDQVAQSPIMFLLKKNPGQQQQNFHQRRVNLESLEDINRSGNRLDDDLTEFEKEWHFHPQPPQLADDTRVNKIFKTRNAIYNNPDAETFNVQDKRRISFPYGSSPQHPIK